MPRRKAEKFPKINLAISHPVKCVKEADVRYWIGPEVDDGLLEEPKQWSNNTVRVGIPPNIVEQFGVEAVMQALANGIHLLTRTI